MNTGLLEENLTEEAFTDAPVEVPAEKDPSRIPRRAPPSRGLCRRCGENRAINRLMLCYSCWVKTELEDSGWREGMPHPDWCACTGLPGHAERLSEGN